MTEPVNDPRTETVTHPPPAPPPSGGDAGGAAPARGFGLPVAIALALMLAALSRRLPADGGPYAYARVAFGNRIGFFNAWSYWITAWAGNAAISVGWVLYVEEVINKGHNKL